MGTINKFKGSAERSREPTAESDIFGLTLTVEKKEGTLPLDSYSTEDSYYQVTVKSTGDNDAYPANGKIWTRNYTRLLPGDNTNVGTDSVNAVPATIRFKGFRLEEDPFDPSCFLMTALLDDKSDDSIRAVSQGRQLSKELVRETCQRALEERVAGAAENEKAKERALHATAVRGRENLLRHAKKFIIKRA